MSQKEKLRKEKFIRNKRSFILLAILSMGIGFAYLTSNLTITGNTSVSGNSWNVYFTNVQVSEGSVEAAVTPTTTGTTTTSIDYTVTLDKPGDFYEFTVDAVNNGTIDAMIQNVNMTSLDTDVEKYLSYTATYLDGTALTQNDVLEADNYATYKVRVEFKKNISASDLDEEGVNLTLSFGVNYVQSTIKQKITEFTKLVKSNALSDSSLDFTQISSASNGTGLYVMNSTTEDTYPIYYYRGAVTNNNAKFAGFCWKIVRTTETGGTKLIYNGLPDQDGYCTNTIGESTQISKSAFNSNGNSPAYNGYMYGNVYGAQSTSNSATYIAGNSFTYDNGTYTLINTKEGIDDNHHYTCFTDSTSCTSVNYVYNIDYSIAYYISLENGRNVEDALREMQTNTNNSSIKTVIDNWFVNSFQTYFSTNSINYNDYLEDTVWCSDRSMNTLGTNIVKINNGFLPNGGGLSNYLYYSGYGRIKAGTPTLTCSSKNDSYTVTETSIGNGALAYPVGLLTMDEVLLAGGQNAENTSYYLYTNQNWWTMTPYDFLTWDSSAFGFISINNGDLDWISPGVSFSNAGVRPSISLKPGVKIASGGDGTSTAPYEFVVE